MKQESTENLRDLTYLMAKYVKMIRSMSDDEKKMLKFVVNIELKDIE